MMTKRNAMALLMGMVGASLTRAVAEGSPPSDHVENGPIDAQPIFTFDDGKPRPVVFDMSLFSEIQVHGDGRTIVMSARDIMDALGASQ